MMAARAFINFFWITTKTAKNMFLVKENQCKNKNKIKRKKKRQKSFLCHVFNLILKMKQMIWVSECRFYFFSSFCMKHVHLTIWLLFEFHSFCNFAKNLQNSMQVRDRLQIPLLKLSRFKRINQLLFPLKWSENLLFSDGFRGDRTEFINSLNFA